MHARTSLGPAICGECTKLGMKCRHLGAQHPAPTWLGTAPRRSGPSWTSSSLQAVGVLACDSRDGRAHPDVCSVLHGARASPGVAWRGDRSPTGEWVTQQARTLVMALAGARHPVTSSSGPVYQVRRQLRHRVRGRQCPCGEDPSRLLVPNAYAERWVRSVRAECLDWILSGTVAILSGGCGLCRPYNRAALTGGSVQVPAVTDEVPLRTGPTERVDVLAGLIHEYRRGLYAQPPQRAMDTCKSERQLRRPHTVIVPDNRRPVSRCAPSCTLQK